MITPLPDIAHLLINALSDLPNHDQLHIGLSSCIQHWDPAIRALFTTTTHKSGSCQCGYTITHQSTHHIVTSRFARFADFQDDIDNLDISNQHCPSCTTRINVSTTIVAPQYLLLTNSIFDADISDHTPVDNVADGYLYGSSIMKMALICVNTSIDTVYLVEVKSGDPLPDPANIMFILFKNVNLWRK